MASAVTMAVMAAGPAPPTAASAMEGNPPAHGTPRLSWLAVSLPRRYPHRLRSRMTRAAGQFMETPLYLLHMAAGRAPMIPLDDALRPTWLFGATVHEGCDRGGYYEQAQFAEEYGLPPCIVKLGCWGRWCNAMWASVVGWRAWADAPMSGNLHRMHHAGVSRRVHALHESAPGLPGCYFFSPPSKLTGGLFTPCAALPRHRSIKSPSVRQRHRVQGSQSPMREK